jgi:DNA-binding beta-propeller fold protein YncE
LDYAHGNVIEYKPGNIVVTTTQDLLFWDLSTHEFRSKHVGVSDYVGHCTALNEPGSFIVQRQRRITLYKEDEEIRFIDNSSLVNWPGSLIELEPFVVVTQTNKNTISVIDLQTRKVLRRYPMKGYLRYFVLE